MPVSVRLDEETETLLLHAAKALRTTKTEVLKASIRSYCRKALEDKACKPYDLIADLIGAGSSGKKNLAADSEEILRKAFRRKK